jgi:hypothetical protein
MTKVIKVNKLEPRTAQELEDMECGHRGRIVNGVCEDCGYDFEDELLDEADRFNDERIENGL